MTKKATAAISLALCLFAYCSCGRRDHANPLDPAVTAGPSQEAATATLTPTFTVPAGATDTFTIAPTLSHTSTPSVSNTPPAGSTDTPTPAPTVSFTATLSYTTSPTPPFTATPTHTLTHTGTYSHTYSQTESFTPPPGATDTFTPTPTDTPGNYPPDADNPYIQYYGRWDKAYAPSEYRASWGPVYVKIRFEGTSCAVRLTDSANNYWYSVDGGAPQTIVANGSPSYSLATGLADTTHELTLVRRSEASFGVTYFQGFTLDAGRYLVPADAPSGRKLEFIGDSITAGFGNDCATMSYCSNTRHNQNGYMAYGPQTARLLNADWHVEAKSGIGIYRSLGDYLPPDEPTMPDYFPRTLFQLASPAWNFGDWQPDGVVVALGTNDFAQVGTYGEPSQAAFEAAYDGFVGYLRANYPAAHIFCMAPFQYAWSMTPTEWTRCRGYIENVVLARQGGGDSAVHFLDPCNGNDTGTGHWLNLSTQTIDWTHPTVAGHTAIATQLAPRIAAQLGW